MKRLFDGAWYRDPSIRAFCYTAPGEYEEGVMIPPSMTITDPEIYQLIPVLEEHGFLKPRLDERLRVEDLKITHRLLDLLEKKA